MKPFYLTLAALIAVAGCSTETPVAPPSAALEGGTPGFAAHSDRRTLVVDDDGADCPKAGYSTIQDAVDDAAPHTTIVVCAGTYKERVVIWGATKSGLRLLAQGGPGAVVLDGVGLPPPGLPGSPTGNHGFHLLEASGVRIDGFTLHGYFENIRLTNANANRIRKNRTSGAVHDGVTLVNSADNVIEHNVAFDNLSFNSCGINVVGPFSARNLIRHNVLSNNNWGVLIQPGAPDNTVFNNVAVENRSHGILTRGNNGTRIENNRVRGNGTEGTGGTTGTSFVFPGGPRAGIGVQRAILPTGVVASNDVTVARNQAFNQSAGVVDLFWDQEGEGNAFVNNHCGTSEPDGLCAHSRTASQ